MISLSEDDLALAFSALSRTQKAIFLGKIAHMETIHVRHLYYQSVSDAAAMFRSNELIHRVCGYMIPVLSHGTEQEQDRSVIAMILEETRPRGQQSLDNLSVWLQEAKT